MSAIAICLINSYANPGHERRVAQRLLASLPDVKVTCSSIIAPEPKEFERTSTTVVNAFLLPVIDDYLAGLERALRDVGVTSALEIMQSDGTTAVASVARERPFLIIESGPAAGVVAAARLAEEMGRPSVITFDMGGTTAKAALLEHFEVGFTEELEVGDSLNRGGGLLRGSGYVVRSPCVDLSEVGAGGGSIAWIDAGGALRVGPSSAGSAPGPACYGAGGTQPTVTDAHVVLGYVNPKSIAGGTKPIYPDLAIKAIALLAERLKLPVLETAFGIYSVATVNMRRAVRAVSVERGRDPRTFSLFAFGGAGGLHAVALASELEMTEVVIPIVPGVFSSLGLLFSDLAVSRVASTRARLAPAALTQLKGVAESLEREATEELRRQQPAAGTLEVETFVGLRYVGQSSTLTMALSFDDPTPGWASERAIAFHAEHHRVHGQSAEGEPIEVVSVRTRAVWRSPKLSFAEIAAQRRAESTARLGAPQHRDLFFGPALGHRVAPIITREELLDAEAAGPVVIEEPDATIVVPPNFSAGLHETGSIVLTSS